MVRNGKYPMTGICNWFLDETEKQFMYEFNYELEAKNLELIYNNMINYNHIIIKEHKFTVNSNGINLIRIPNHIKNYVHQKYL